MVWRSSVGGRHSLRQVSSVVRSMLHHMLKNLQKDTSRYLKIYAWYIEGREWGRYTWCWFYPSLLAADTPQNSHSHTPSRNALQLATNFLYMLHDNKVSRIRRKYPARTTRGLHGDLVA